MSWAEIKKAVNSRMADMPLDDMFGLEYVGKYTPTTSSPKTVTGFDGVMQLYQSGGIHISVTDQTLGLNYLASPTDYAPCCIIPIVKNHVYRITSHDATSESQAAYIGALIFAWGGYFLNALKNLLQAPLAEGRC